MDFLTQNWANILVLLGAVYPPLIFLLPAKYATRLDLGVKIIKSLGDSLDKAKSTKGGLSSANGM